MLFVTLAAFIALSPSLALAGCLWDQTDTNSFDHVDGLVWGGIWNKDLKGHYDYDNRQSISWHDCVYWAKGYGNQIHAIRTLAQADGVFFTLPWWNNFPQAYPGGKNGGVDPNTPYGAQGLTSCQYNIVLQLTSVFENGTPSFNWGSCENINDGNGYSAGFIQFTTLSGSALQVVQTYANNGNADGNLKQALANYIPALQNVQGSGSTDGLDGFCDAWANAANNDNAFHDAQLQIQENGYLVPNHDLVINLGVKLKVSVGQLYDCSIQLGLDGTNQIVNTVGATTPANGGDEVTWLNQFLQARINYLNNIGGAYADTLYRVYSYQHVVNGGNDNFNGGSVEALDNGGSPITLSC
ncbi:hypothetical protein HDU76_012169 [Blyttiomyces sp. JEL0837]|nr:hypothetical protein HDU76_012169 [Blyttiomyces sp. JEL0837]